MSRVVCTLYLHGSGSSRVLRAGDVLALCASSALSDLVASATLHLTQPEEFRAPADLVGPGVDAVSIVCGKLERAVQWPAVKEAVAALLDALPPQGKASALEVLAELKGNAPAVPHTDASEVLGDTARIEACKERLRPACCLVLCASTRPPRLRCQCNALILWVSLLCSLLCSWMRSLLRCRWSCRRCAWLAAVVEQQQYKLHTEKAQAQAASGAPPGAHLTGCCKEEPEERRDPFFCVGEYSVALQRPTPFLKLIGCACSPAAAQSPAGGNAGRSALGNEIDHLSLVEGLLTVHCFRTFELALLTVLSLACTLGAVFFFTAQALIRAGLVPGGTTFAAADLFRCTEGVAVAGAPQALSCFLGEAQVDPGAALGFAQTLAATGGALTFNASLLAAATCAPVLGAMTSTVSLFYIPGLIQRAYVSLMDSNPYTAEISSWLLWLLTAWSLVPLAALLLIGLLACDKRSPVPRKADSLRLLLTAEAREFMMCVGSSCWPPTFPLPHMARLPFTLTLTHSPSLLLSFPLGLMGGTFPALTTSARASLRTSFPTAGWTFKPLLWAPAFLPSLRSRQCGPAAW